ncbi:MAG: hypothetical protein ACREJ5_08070, partial [Geminicoccaceae bacterium]
DTAAAGRKAPRRTRARRRPTAASERAGASRRAERPEAAEEEAGHGLDAPSEAAVRAAAVVDQDSSEPPRRGWWSRFVRKDE